MMSVDPVLPLPLSFALNILAQAKSTTTLPPEPFKLQAQEWPLISTITAMVRTEQLGPAQLRIRCRSS
jgi:hypothetical protein